MSLEHVPNKELEVGIAKSLKNAEALIDEGDILFNKNRFSRAYCLYQLAAEEVGKTRLLFALIMSRKLGENIDYKVVNKEFLHHQTKSRSALTFEKLALIIMFSNKKDKTASERKADFLEALQRVNDENDIDVLNTRKNNSLYVGLKDEKFFEPSDVISKEMAVDVRANALIRFKAGETVLREMLSDLDNIVGLIKQAEQSTEGQDGDKFFDTFFKD